MQFLSCNFFFSRWTFSTSLVQKLLQMQVFRPRIIPSYASQKKETEIWLDCLQWLSFSFSNDFRRSPRQTHSNLETLASCLNLGRLNLGTAPLNVVNTYSIYPLHSLVWDGCHFLYLKKTVTLQTSLFNHLIFCLAGKSDKQNKIK